MTLATTATRYVCLIALASTACRPSRAPVAGHRPAPSTWREYEIGEQGVYARFPVEPAARTSVHRSASRGDEEPVRSNSLIASQNGRSFGCAVSRAEVFHGTLPPSLRPEVFAGFFRGLARTSPAPDLAGYAGEVFIGISPDGHERTGVVYGLSDGLLVAWVDSVTNPVDRSEALRFFASLRIDPPWQVRASVSLGLVVAIPALAAESSTPGRVDFTVSGRRPVTYSVVVTAAPAASTPSRSLDHVKPPEGAVSSSTSIEHDGLAGKEWRSTNGNRHARARAFATESRLYWTLVVANSEEQLDDADARRFLESLRVF